MAPEDFRDAFEQAKRHTYVPYAVDVWSLEKRSPGLRSDLKVNRQIQACAYEAMKLYQQGKAALFQRKRYYANGINTFDYLVFKL